MSNNRNSLDAPGVVKLCFGVVKNNADPMQHGRLQIYIPSEDGPKYEVKNLPWCNYVSPFGGVTADFKVGRESDDLSGISAYGFWAIPKNGAQVLCGYLNGNTNVRFWMGCMFMPEHNRTLPQSVNDIKTDIDDSGLYPQKEIEHYRTNLGEAGLAPGDKHYDTRGGYERSVSHPSNKDKVKPTTDGYYPKPLEKDKADSQVISLTTPGRHYIALSDVDKHCRMRFKSTAGNQIIIDDTNERIYVSTAMGRNYFELDEGSGKIYFYTASKFNVHAENDINLTSDKNINIIAKDRVNIVSLERSIKLQASYHISGKTDKGNINFTASRDLVLKTTNGEQGSAIDKTYTCSAPPYSGNPLGKIWEQGEPAGSKTSKIFINAVEHIEICSDKESVLTSAKMDIHNKTVMGSIYINSGVNINLMGIAFNTSFASIGMNSGCNTVRPPWIVQSANVATMATTAKTAESFKKEDIKPMMVIPMHESWDRDEDEQSCKTERNKNYQG